MSTEQISCGYNQIMDIISATIAYVEEEVICSADSLMILKIMQGLPRQCKVSTKDSAANVYIK